MFLASGGGGEGMSLAVASILAMITTEASCRASRGSAASQHGTVCECLLPTGRRGWGGVCGVLGWGLGWGRGGGGRPADAAAPQLTHSIIIKGGRAGGGRSHLVVLANLVVDGGQALAVAAPAPGSVFWSMFLGWHAGVGVWLGVIQHVQLPPKNSGSLRGRRCATRRPGTMHTAHAWAGRGQAAWARNLTARREIWGRMRKISRTRGRRTQ